MPEVQADTEAPADKPVQADRLAVPGKPEEPADMSVQAVDTSAAAGKRAADMPAADMQEPAGTRALVDMQAAGKPEPADMQVPAGMSAAAPEPAAARRYRR